MGRTSGNVPSNARATRSTKSPRRRASASRSTGGAGPRCAACGLTVEFDPAPAGGWDRAWGPCPVQPANLAIRCGFCFGVFCRGCSLRHFEIENEQRMVDAVAARVVREVRAGEVRGPEAAVRSGSRRASARVRAGGRA